MQRANGLTLLGVALVLVGCGPRSTGVAVLTPEHAVSIGDSVTTTLEAFRAAFAARDFRSALRFYADDPRFRWIEDGELRYTSRAAVATALLAFAPAVRALELSYFDPVVTPLGPGVAVVTSRFVQKLTDTTGAVRGLAGTMSVTMIHADSGWRFLVGHTSTVVPQARPVPAAK